VFSVFRNRSPQESRALILEHFSPNGPLNANAGIYAGIWTLSLFTHSGSILDGRGHPHEHPGRLGLEPVRLGLRRRSAQELRLSDRHQ
jgi:hypothetical protein